LAQSIIEVGRINKTLYLLNYIDDENYRRRILTQLNRGEGRHFVAVLFVMDNVEKFVSDIVKVKKIN
jgi:TnpA family transposase